MEAVQDEPSGAIFWKSATASIVPGAFAVRACEEQAQAPVAAVSADRFRALALS
jgi:hypothetical protein